MGVESGLPIGVEETANLIEVLDRAAFLQTIEAERERLLAEYDANPVAFRSRLGIALGVDAPQQLGSQSSGLGILPCEQRCARPFGRAYGRCFGDFGDRVIPPTMPRIQITRSISIDEDELSESFVRSSGPGGQHVNTTDSAVMLRFDAWGSPNLPDMVKHRLTDLAGSRITKEGVLVLRSEGSRSQLLNRQEVRERLIALIVEATIIPKRRRPTKPSKAAKARRADGKSARGVVKSLRGKVRE